MSEGSVFKWVQGLIGLVGPSGDEITSTTDDTKERLDVSSKVIPDSESIYTSIAVSSTAAVMRVGAANLEGRQSISIQPKGGTIYIGYDATVTSGNAGSGIKVANGSMLTLSKDENVDIYAIKAGGGTINTHVTESKK